jgi:hypothetical protein
VRDFLERHVGGDGIGREHKHDRVGFADQRLNALPPILEGINLGAVDQRLEAARLEGTFEPIGEGNVLARIGDEDSGRRRSFRRLIGSSDHQQTPPRRTKKLADLKKTELVWHHHLLPPPGHSWLFCRVHDVGGAFELLEAEPPQASLVRAFANHVRAHTIDAFDQRFWNSADVVGFMQQPPGFQ